MLEPGTCFLALEQTAGKGQRGKQWVVNPGENITMSTVFAPSQRNSGTAPSRIRSFPFLLSAAVVLGCYDFIKGFGVPDLFIKWPNDVYSGDRKAAGVLIENLYKGQLWEWAVAGTGINLNQTEFPLIDKKPVSIRMYTGKQHDVVQMGKLLHKFLSARYTWLEAKSADEIMDEYNSRLYRKGDEVRLKKESMVFTTRIVNVSANGELVTSDTLERKFKVGEVDFV